ncbi:hypothetical protein SDC9_156433 [bioreactor metagenome]|uniref:Uncharacterized protein n=1 Tax=bioreactor metagenome TaxID=1076179 RepID=A0A645F485_9ZZZZ
MFPNIFEGIGTFLNRVSNLIIFECFLIFSFSVKRIADSDVSLIKVRVSLKQFLPVVYSRIIVSLCIVLESSCYEITVICTFIYCNRVRRLIHCKKIGPFVAYRRNALKLTYLSSLFTENEQKLSIVVIGVYLLTIRVDNTPHPVRAESNIDDA